jgi:hypothetical protein
MCVSLVREPTGLDFAHDLVRAPTGLDEFVRVRELKLSLSLSCVDECGYALGLQVRTRERVRACVLQKVYLYYIYITYIFFFLVYAFTRGVAAVSKRLRGVAAVSTQVRWLLHSRRRGLV